MTPTHLNFHHFGLASSVPERAILMLESMGYACGKAVFDPLQRVFLRWCTHERAPAVEVVTPADDESPLKSILSAQTSSFYHLCWETDLSCDDALTAIRANGTRVVTVRDPMPAVLFGGRRVSFHIVHGFGLVEILEGDAQTDADST